MSGRIERNELYAAIWSEPATKIAARYGITSTMLAKICRKLRVPTPPRGYWAKKAAGQRVTRTPLPRMLSDQATVHVFTEGGQPAPPEPPAVATERERARIVVPEETELHPLLRRYETRLRHRGEKAELWSEMECIAIHVSSEQLERALRIMSALLHAFDERGIAIEVTQPGGGSDAKSETIVTVQGERFHMGLGEGSRWETPPPDPTSPPPAQGAWKTIADPRKRAAAYAAELLASREHSRAAPPKPARHVWSGELRLWMSPLQRSWHAWGQRQFRDTPKHKLEDRLSRFVIQLHVIAENVRQERERHQREAERRAEEERIRAERERVQQRHDRLRKDLAQRVDAYRRAGEIRALIDAIAARPTLTPSAQAWIEWARGRAEVVEQVALDVERVWDTA